MAAAAATAATAVVASRCGTLKPDDKLLENCQKEAREAPKGLWTDHDVMTSWRLGSGGEDQ